MRLDCHAEAVGEPLGRHAQMHFALPEQLQFRHLGVLHKGERAILFAKLGERAGEPHLVLSVLDANSDALGRRRSGGNRGGRRRGPSAKRSPVARLSRRAKAMVSPSSARATFEDTAPMSRARPPMRSSTPWELTTVAPSTKALRSTRASDNLPPCAVWIVRSACARAGPLSSI